MVLKGQDEPQEENFEGEKTKGGTVYARRRTQKAEMGASRKKAPLTKQQARLTKDVPVWPQRLGDNL